MDEALRRREHQLEEALVGSARILKQLRVHTAADNRQKQRPKPQPRRRQGTALPSTLTVADEEEALGVVIHSVRSDSKDDVDGGVLSGSNGHEGSDSDSDDGGSDDDVSFYMKLMAHKFRE